MISDLMREKARALGVSLTKWVDEEILYPGESIEIEKLKKVVENFVSEWDADPETVVLRVSDYEESPGLKIAGKIWRTENDISFDIQKQEAIKERMQEAERRLYEELKQKYGREEGV